MNRFYNLPIEIQKRILNFRLEKELNDKIKERMENNINDYNSGEKKIFCKLVEMSGGVPQRLRSFWTSQIEILIKELENEDNRMIWGLILLPIEYKLLNNNTIIGLKFYSNFKLLEMIHDNELEYAYGLRDHSELVRALLNIA